MASNYKLKTQINMSFLILIALLVVVSIASYASLSREHQRYKAYKELANDSVLAGHLDTYMLRTRMGVKDFLILNDEASLARYEESLASFSQNLERAQSDIQKLDRAGKVDSIEDKIGVYAATVNEVTAIVRDRNRLVADLDSLGPAIRKIMTSVKQETFVRGDYAGAQQSAAAQESLLLGRLYMFKFLQSTEPADFQRAYTELGTHFGNLLDSMTLTLTDDVYQRKLSEVGKLFDTYLSTVQQLSVLVTQRKELVRGRLDVIGPDIAQLSDAVSDSVVSDQRALGSVAAQQYTNALMMLAVIVVGAMVCSVVLALKLRGVIWRPLGAEPTRLYDITQSIGNTNLEDLFLSTEVVAPTGVLAGLVAMRDRLMMANERDRLAMIESRQLRKAIDSSVSCMYVVDSAGDVMYLNEAMVASFTEASGEFQDRVPGFLPSALLDTSASEFLDLLKPNLAREVLVREGSHTTTLEIGKRTYVLVSSSISDDDNEQASYMGTVVEWREITTQLALDEELKGVMQAAISGNLDVRIGDSAKDNPLCQGINQLMDITGSVVSDCLQVLEAIAIGDLRKTISTQYQGDFKRLKDGANTTVHSLSTLISKMSENSTTLGSASKQLAAANSVMKDTSYNGAKTTKVLARTASEIDMGVSMIAAGTEEMSASIKEISNSTLKATQVATEAVETARETDVTVRQLSDSSASIGNVIKVITSIAEQTNLLALNATIEAARAGDAGKGFAVVANEVKELAKETAMATDDIRVKITTIQSDSERAVSAIGRISDQVNQISDIQELITSAIGEQQLTTSDMSKSANSAYTQTNEIAARMEGAAKDSEQTLAVVEDVQQSAVSLSGMADDLQELTRKFKLSA